ncbi:MAG: TetR/AcrR family transcriptional regulator [Chitinophagales bacterium]
MIDTKEKILQRALEMFNEKAIEYVGLREIAKDLNMRVGNITYYFPTKDDLVMALIDGLRKRNEHLILYENTPGMLAFLQRLQQQYQNQLYYKCLLLSFVHIMRWNQRAAEMYRGLQDRRYNSIDKVLSLLHKNGYLNTEGMRQKDLLVNIFALHNRFWLSEAQISFSDLDDEAVMRKYLRNFALFLYPYATDKGIGDIDTFISSLQAV